MSNKYKKISIIIILSAAGVIFGPRAHASAATLYLSPSGASITKGNNITLGIRTNTGGVTINGAHGTVNFPSDKFTFIAISCSSSFSISSPDTGGGGGSATFGCAKIGNSSGDVQVASLTLRAKLDSGSATVSFGGGGEVDRDDGSGTNVLSGTGGGSYTFKAPAAAAPATPAAPADKTPPTITAVTVSDIGPDTATISWTTSEAATSRVDFGLNDKYGAAETVAGLASAHKVVLNSALIQAGVTYHFKVASNDAAGNPATGQDMTFTTKGITLVVTVSAKNGKLLKNATVVLGDKSVKTDAKGVATFNDLPSGKQTLVITYKGKTTTSPVNVTGGAKITDPQTVKVSVAAASTSLMSILMVLAALILLGAAGYGARWYLTHRGPKGPSKHSGGGGDVSKSDDKDAKPLELEMIATYNPQPSTVIKPSNGSSPPKEIKKEEFKLKQTPPPSSI
jgi:hypothetical protein